MNKLERLLRRVALTLGAAALAAGVAGAAEPETATNAQDGPRAEDTQLGQVPAAPAYAARGAETCLRCHDKPPATNILNTPHAMKADSRTPFAAYACETCHGASPEHMRAPGPDGKRTPATIRFTKGSTNTAEEQNSVCLGCHSGSTRMNWKGSVHQANDVTCATCHNVHTTRDRVRAKATQPEVCFTCHREQRAEVRRPSHHPILEGKVACSESHNPHGSPTDKQFVGITLNETCYGCHAEKRGPYLWEHAPGREDCSICHYPHGTIAPRLLKFRVPWLCETCHSASAHPSTLYSGATRLPGGTQLFYKGCVNCHSQIHGSNHPSGVRFMR